MKSAILIILILFSFSLTYSQNLDFRLKENKFENSYKKFSSNGIKTFADSTVMKETPAEKRSRKSPGLAFIYSLLVPGLGHAYAHRFETGKYFLISEGALWLTFAAFSIYGNWLLDDAYSYSVTHAGVNLSGKSRDDKFFTDIGNYNSIYDYNDEQLRFGNYSKLYDPSGYYFYWDNETNRRKYREDKIAGDKTLNDRLFVIGAAVINHIVSAISAVFAANSYNDEIKSGGKSLTFNAGVKKHFNRIDGISLKITKWF